MTIYKLLETQFRKFIPKRMDNYRQYRDVLKGKNGLEIGGPSSAFSSKGYLPVYDVIGHLDGCNFSNETVWEGNIQEGNSYHYGNKTGFQIIADAADLVSITSSKYDFLLSCHSLEHIANPIKALIGWKRVIKENGYVVLVVPHKDQTFDHKRPITTLEHLKNDFAHDIQEDDNTHFQEVNTLHDISKDPGISDAVLLRERTAQNISNRCVHHHVFNTPLVAQLANHVGFKILDIRHFNPFNIIFLLQKTTDKPDNAVFLDKNNPVYDNARFPSDKIW